MKIKIGKIIEPKGLQGKLKVFFLSTDPSWIEDVEYVYLGSDHKKYQIKDIRPTKNAHKWEMDLEGITNRNQSDALKGQEVFLEEEFFKSNSEEFFLKEILHFEVYDKQKLFGVIVGFGSNGAQDLIEVKKESGEVVLVPLVKAFIEKTDMKNKKVFMDLPEGF